MTQEAARDALAARRDRVDFIDLRILELLNERTRAVEEIGEIKRAANLPVYEPKREDQVFRNIAENNCGPLSTDAARRVFERIIDEMRKIQRERMENETCS